ncbi:MAG: DUF4252 domain-containing protein [Tenuifilaceae bacterium]|jgi:hypothetical protein|nr:DUF4252 domain-containing protein [Tenuifilaceae bacterium]
MLIKFRFPLIIVFSILSTFWACNDESVKKESSYEIFQSYRDKGVGTLFTVPPGLASVFLDDEQPGNKELKALLSDTKKLTFLIIPNDSKSKENVYYSDINTRLNRILFQDLAAINSGNEIITVKVQSDNSEMANEMVVLVTNYQNIFCVSFQGSISLTKIANLTQPDNISIISNLNRFNR